MSSTKKKNGTPAPRAKRVRHGIPADAFIRSWQAAASAEACAEVLKIPVATANSRACNLRKRGIPLRRFGPHRRYDEAAIAELAELARSLAPPPRRRRKTLHPSCRGASRRRRGRAPRIRSRAARRRSRPRTTA